MAKIVRSNLTDQIFDYMKKQISEGIWKAGEKIPSEIELSESLGVSRVSLRNAIKKSNLLGITETRVGEGTFVCPFNMRNYIKELYTTGLLPKDYNKINDLRYILQYGSIEFALETNDLNDAVTDLREILVSMEEAASENNMESFHTADMAFHRKICKISQNDLLYMIYDALESFLNDLVYENVSKSVAFSGDWSMVLEHHRRLVEGIEKKDFSICEKALRASRERSHRFYQDNGLYDT